MIRSRKDHPQFFVVNDNLTAELAFVVDGVGYYWFRDQVQMPSKRALMSLAIYQEMKMGVDKEYLDKHCDEVDKILNTPRPTIAQLSRLALLHKNLKERSQLMVLPEYIYKLASVVFFTLDEPPGEFDFNFMHAKIEHWKQSGATVSFFLNSPLKNLIPSLPSSNEDLNIYFQTVTELDKLHRNDLISP